MDDRMAAAAAEVNGKVDELIRRMNAKAVFGEPIQQGDVTLIPVASVMYGFGAGQGWGRGPKEGKEGEPAGVAKGQQNEGEGAGAGGGGGGVAKPIGYIHIDANGAHWVPTMDMTRVSVGGMLLGGWIVFWVMKMIRTVVTAAGKKKNCC